VDATKKDFMEKQRLVWTGQKKISSWGKRKDPSILVREEGSKRIVVFARKNGWKNKGGGNQKNDASRELYVVVPLFMTALRETWGTE